jgi:hypothetical protein
VARRRKKLPFVLGGFLLVFFGVYTSFYFWWNDAAMGEFVSKMASNGLRGNGPNHRALTVAYAHYPYWGALRSIFLGGTVGIDARDASVWDFDGKQALHIEKVHANLYLGQLVWAQFFGLFGRDDLELHCGDVEVWGGFGHVGIDSEGMVNLPGAMTSKVRQSGDGGMRIKLEHVQLHDIEYQMAMPGWHGEVNHLEGAAKLSLSGFPEEQEPGKMNFHVDVSPLKAESGKLTLGTAPGEFVFPLGPLDITKFQVEGDKTNDLIYTASTTTRGASVSVDGRLISFAAPPLSTELTIKFDHGADLVKMLPTGDLLGGDPAGEVRIHGPLAAILIDGHAQGAEVHLAGVTGKVGSGEFHLKGNTLTLDHLAVGLGRGTVGGVLAVDFQKMNWKGDLECKGVDPSGLAPLVPEQAHELLAGHMTGTAHVEGSLVDHPDRIKIRDLDLELTRRRKDQLPPVVLARGALKIAPKSISLDGLSLMGDGLTATAKGEIDPVKLTTLSDVTIDAAHLRPLLSRWGLDFDVAGLHAAAHVEGPLVQPFAEGSASARTVGGGERILPRVDAKLRLANGTIHATEIRGVGPLGGELHGDVAIGLFDGAFTRPRRDPSVKAHLDTKGLSLEAIADVPWLTGRASGSLDLDGTLGNPNGTAQIDVPTLKLYGDPYRKGALTVAIGDGKYAVQKLSLERERGGKLWGSGVVTGDGDLDLDLRSDAFPLAAIPQLRDVPVALAGTLSGSMRVEGNVDNWSPRGTIAATAVKVRDILLGDGKLSIVPGGDAIHLTGDFFHKFRVDGYLTLRPHIAVNVTVAFTDYPLAELIPELKKLAEVQSIVSGQATFSFDLLQGITVAELRLDKVLLSVAGDDEDDEEHTSGRRMASFSNEGPVVIATDGKKLTFRQAVMRSALGQFEIKGDLSPIASSLLVRGQIDLHLLEYFFSSLFVHTHGSAFADLRIFGPAQKPQVLGTLDLQNAELKPRGAEKAFLVPSGSVVFTPKGVKLHDLRAQLDDAEARAEASLGLVDWVPGDISADISGELSPTLLTWIFPDHVGETEGRFEVQAHVGGHWSQPTWSGRIQVTNERPLFFHEKRIGRDVRISEGTVFLDDYDIKLGCPRDVKAAPAGCKTIKARIDDTGEVRIDGTVGLPGFELGRVGVHLEGDNLDWASPGIYSVTMAPRLDLTGDGKHLRLAGAITVIAGRYQQNFEYKDLVIRPRTVESDTPFYEGTPLLEQLELDLALASSGALAIKDNLADLNVSIPSLRVRGTLSQPNFAGSIFVEEGGAFKIPFLRAEFVSEKGTITFDPDKEYPEKTPSLSIRASADWIDRYEQQHHILLTVSGTYREPFVDLSSTDGWNRTQVLAALVTGGAPDDLRRSLQNDPTNKGAGAGAFDGVAKSLSGDFIGNIIDDVNNHTFRLDVARVELGSDSVQIKLCPWRTRYLKLCGTADVGFVTSTTYNANGEFKLSDSWSAAGLVERIQHGIDTSEDILTRGKLQLMFRHPLH